MLPPSRRALRRKNARSPFRFTRLRAEHLEERTLLTASTCDSNGGATLVCYQLRVVPVNGALFAPDPQNAHGLVATPDLTSVNVGDSFDLVVTTQSSDPTYYGVYAAYLDIGYDSSKAHVQVAEVQNLTISGSGSFSLQFGAETTASITKVSDPVALAASIQSALAALPSIGAGNIEVTYVAIPFSTGRYEARFVGKFFDSDVPNMTVVAGATATVSIAYDGDLAGGPSAYAFREAFRSRGVQEITTVPGGNVYYMNGVGATAQTNLLDEVGAFGTGSAPFPGQPTAAETAAGITVAPPREVVRARMVATAAGTLSFTPDVSNILHPVDDTLVYVDLLKNPTMSPKVAANQMNLGSPVTLSVGSATPITAVADQAAVLANADATVIDVLANDTTSPATGQTKNVIAVTQPSHGIVTFTATGVSYKPATDFAGTDTFTYTAQNITAGNGSATSTTTVTVTVAAPITAVADSATMSVGAASITIDVLANDTTSPATGQAKSIVSVGQPSHGATSLDNSGKVVYAPTTGFSGSDTFTYTARNLTAGATSLTSTAVVTVTVPSPSSAAMHYQVRIVPVGGALFMPDALNPTVLIPTPDLSTVTVGGAYDLVVTVQASDPNSLGVFAGYLDIGYDESKTWVAAADAGGNISAADFLNAFAPKGVPEISGIPSSANYFTNGLSAGNLPNLIDDVGAFANTSLPNWPGELSNAEKAAGITVAPPRELVRATFRAVVAGSVTFTPDITNLLHPAHDTLLLGGNSAIPINQIDVGSSRTIVIAPPMVAVNDTAAVAEDSGGTSIDVLANDTTSPATGQTKNVVAVTQPAHGSVTFTATGVTYTPAPNYFGPDAFTYTAQNLTAGGGSATATATVMLTVSGVNDQPTLDPIPGGFVYEDPGLQSVPLSGISAGGGESQTLTITASSDNPALTGDISVDYSSPNSTGSFSFTPQANQSGIAHITITVQDNGGTAGGGQDTLVRTYEFFVASLNDAPTLDPIADQTVNEDGSLEVLLSGVSAGPNEESQTVTITATSDNTALIDNIAVLYSSPDSNGKLAFAPKANLSGTATITVTVKDDGGAPPFGGQDTTTRTFTVTVNPVNDFPSFDFDGISGDITIDDKPLIIPLIGINAGPGESQSLSFTASAFGKPYLIHDFSFDYSSPNSTGTLTITPEPNQSGTTEIAVFLQDDGGTANGGWDTLVRTFDLTIKPVNDPPTLDAILDRTINEDALQQLILLSGISAGAYEYQFLTVNASSNNPDLGDIAIDYTSPNSTGSLWFTPQPNQSGTATISVTVHDSGGVLFGGVDTVVQTFKVTVLPVNDAPSFIKGPNQDTDDEAGDVMIPNWATAISAGPDDEHEQTLTWTVTADNKDLFKTQPAIDAAGNLTYTPALNMEGTTQVSIVLQDDGGTENGGQDTSTQTLVIHVAKLHPLHNAAKPFDATGDNSISPADPLACINYINGFKPGPVDQVPPGMGYLDVNGDGFVSGADPLEVINFINAYGSQDGEGESSAAVDVLLTAPPPPAASQPTASDNLASLIALLALDGNNPTCRRRG